MQLHGIILL